MTQRKRGFTIIEVVLVLAVAGLIFMMVFVALPSLQRSQRNTQRRRDFDRVIAAATEYKTHNKNQSPWVSTGRGNLTDNTVKLVAKYLDPDFTGTYTHGSYNSSTGKVSPMEATGCSEAFMDPSGRCYNIVAVPIFGASLSNSVSGIGLSDIADIVDVDISSMIVVFPRADCGEQEGYVVNTGKPNQFALVTKLENAGWYCVASK